MFVRLTIAFTCAVVLVPTAARAQYAPEGDTLGVSDSTVVPGGDVELTGSGFEPDTTIRITLESSPILLTRTRADDQGRLSETVTIPEDVEPGQHTLKATGVTPDGSTLVLSSTITVGGGGALAFTGFPALLPVLLGLALAAGGVVLLRLRRRERA